MARAKLLRQSIEDYQRKVGVANQGIEAANAQYQGAYDAYSASVNAYNTAAAAVPYVVKVNDSNVYLSNGKLLARALDPALDPKGIESWVGKFYMGGGVVSDTPGVAAPLPAPAEPTPPDMPRAPNLTNSNMRELANPSQDMAGMQQSENRGIIAKSELPGMGDSKNSAFSDPEDPNNLKGAGILARVIGGQL